MPHQIKRVNQLMPIRQLVRGNSHPRRRVIHLMRGDAGWQCPRMTLVTMCFVLAVEVTELRRQVLTRVEGGEGMQRQTRKNMTGTMRRRSRESVAQTASTALTSIRIMLTLSTVLREHMQQHNALTVECCFDQCWVSGMGEMGQDWSEVWCQMQVRCVFS